MIRNRGIIFLGINFQLLPFSWAFFEFENYRLGCDSRCCMGHPSIFNPFLSSSTPLWRFRNFLELDRYFSNLPDIYTKVTCQIWRVAVRLCTALRCAPAHSLSSALPTLHTPFSKTNTPASNLHRSFHPR